MEIILSNSLWLLYVTVTVFNIISQRRGRLFYSVIPLYIMLGKVACATNGYLFDDSVLFSLNWPGNRPDASDQLTELISSDTVSITSNAEETYKCVVPKPSHHKTIEKEEYTGQSPEEMIDELHHQTKEAGRGSCSYRLETYWTYELCHGNHLRQFHEEKEMGKATVVQSFVLGKYSDDRSEKSNQEKRESGSLKLPLKRFENSDVPSYVVNYTDGAVCELTQKPRITHVYYICDPNGRNEIYHLEETSTCEYEVLILNKELCRHPELRREEELVNLINCFPSDGSPTEPINWTFLQKEIDEVQQKGALPLTEQIRVIKPQVQATEVQRTKTTTTTTTTTTPESGGALPLTEQIRVIKPQVQATEVQRTKTTTTTTTTAPESGVRETYVRDKEIVKSFLKGEWCLGGGSGWWKHEICYGKAVYQFHVEVSADKTKKMTQRIRLGKWDEEEHKSWFKSNNLAINKDHLKSVRHYYAAGEVCDVTGAARTVEVKLKCATTASSEGVSIYLTEPRTCHYEMGVESPIICNLLNHVDEFGIPRVDFDQL